MQSSNPLIMLADELVSQYLIMKVREADKDRSDLAGEDRAWRVRQYALMTESYGALVRATGYVLGHGIDYGTPAWRGICLVIKGIVRQACAGYDDGNANEDDRKNIFASVVMSLHELRVPDEVTCDGSHCMPTGDDHSRCR